MNVKQLLMSRATRAAAVVLAGALIVVAPAVVAGQPAPSVQAPATTAPDMMAMRKNMMAMREKMMMEMTASDARLQQLVAQMNAAKGDAKIDAMAALLVELTGQHRAAQQRMGQMMMPEMMQMMDMMDGMNMNMQNMMRGRGPATPSGK